jgi:SAM-dependent methyltransferase
MTNINRNERLYPRWSNPNYYGLIQLRKNIEQIIENHFISGLEWTLIDYGCGSMPYKELYVQKIKKYIGADLKQNANASVFIDQNTGKIDVLDNIADVIVSTQVLEHVENPKSYLLEASRVCKIGGLLIISTHGFFPYHPDPSDYWRWTASGLNKLLDENNWEVVNYKGIIGYSGVGLSFIQYSISKKLYSFLKTPFVFSMQRIIMLVDRFWYKKEMTRKENCVLYVFVARNRKTNL